jgi:hypothetical protein
MSYRKYIQKGLTVVQVVIAFAVIALHVVTMLPALLRGHKRSQGLEIPRELRTADSAFDSIATTKVTGGSV